MESLLTRLGIIDKLPSASLSASRHLILPLLLWNGVIQCVSNRATLRAYTRERVYASRALGGDCNHWHLDRTATNGHQEIGTARDWYSPAVQGVQHGDVVNSISIAYLTSDARPAAGFPHRILTQSASVPLPPPDYYGALRRRVMRSKGAASTRIDGASPTCYGWRWHFLEKSARRSNSPDGSIPANPEYRMRSRALDSRRILAPCDLRSRYSSRQTCANSPAGRVPGRADEIRLGQENSTGTVGRGSRE